MHEPEVPVSHEPTPKVAAVGTAGVLVTGIVALLSLVGVVVPEEISDQAVVAIVAGTAVVQFAAGYIKKSRRGSGV